MSKVMSMLEKLNLVEKVNKENPQHNKLNEKSKNDLGEALNDGKNIFKIETAYNKEEIKASKPVIKEKSSAMGTSIEYEKKMMIDEIYSSYGLENSSINTVFMLENLINALPQNLPKDVIKQSVINIIDASKIDLKELLSDGEKRLGVLVKVMDGYSNQTNKCIAEYKEEIDKLTCLISNYQEQIKIKESMLDEEISLIKYESQKIDGIIDFFSK